MNTNVIDNIRYSINKLRKLYPLHIFTMLLMIILFIVVNTYEGWKVKRIILLVVNTAANLTLTQTWIPTTTVNTSLNGVAWYLSVTLFLYFAFPYIMLFIKKNDNKNKLVIISIILLVLQLCFAAMLNNINGYDNSLFIWGTYCFPVFRLVDFSIGCNLGYIMINFKSNNETVCVVKSTILESLAILITIFVDQWVVQDSNKLIPFILKNHTTIYIPLAVMWVYLFFNCKGLITKMFTNKIFAFIGNVSAYAFLIHFVIVRYYKEIRRAFELSFSIYIQVLIALIFYILTIGLSILYRNIFATEKKN